MTRWKQQGSTLIAVVLVTAAGGIAYGQVRGAATASAKAAATVGVQPGPLQKVGEKADKALDKAGETINQTADKAGEKLNGAADSAGEKLDKAGDTVGEKLDKAADNVEKKLDEAGRSAKKAQREASAKVSRAALRSKVEASLKGQRMPDAMKQELKRHAQRIARLERVKDVAKDVKDDETATRAGKLIDKEDARHDKWMAEFDAKAEVKAGAK